jgi:hypothetical protein
MIFSPESDSVAVTVADVVCFKSNRSNAVALELLDFLPPFRLKDRLMEPRGFLDFVDALEPFASVFKTRIMTEESLHCLGTLRYIV